MTRQAFLHPEDGWYSSGTYQTISYGGTKLKALAVQISQHSKNDHSSSLVDLELLLRVPD